MDYFQQFILERNIQKSTIKGYVTSINKYTSYYDMTLEELLEEAIQEENDNVDKRKRSIRIRLLQFRTYLVTETDLRMSTIQGHMKKITSLYKHYDIELPNLPPIKMDDKVETTYYDLPTREQISMILEVSGIRIKSLILFMVSSGTGRTECSNITINDFLEATRDFHTSETLPEILDELYGYKGEVVPTFYILRQKTNKKYYTFCTPECTDAIVEWLQLRLKVCEQKGVELTPEDKLWDLTTRQITYHLSNINDELNFGFKGTYRFLRPHTLRKFHASNIGLNQEHIDLLQGRSEV